MRRNLMTAAAAALVVGTTVLTAPAASAATALPLSGFGDIVVDQVHQRVFVSGGPTSNGIVVTDFAGNVVKSINSQSGATGLELSADGNLLFAALAAGDAISVISTTSLTETHRYSTGPCPTHLARSKTAVWFGYGCEGTFAGKIGKLEHLAAKPVTGDLQGATRYQRAPLLTATDTDMLIAGQLALSLSTVQVYQIETGALTPDSTGEVGAGLVDLDLTPDGLTLHSAAGSRDRVEAWSPTNLARRGAYAARPRPNAVAVTERFVAVGALTGDANDVLVYEHGGSVPTATRALATGDTVVARGLAWGADRLFVITSHDNRPQPNIAVFTV
ncbi:YncE family protein [Saccharothrix stipae]